LVEVLRDDPRYRNRPRTDFPSFGGVPVFSQRAIEALRDLLEPCGEILPLRCHEGTYFAYNVTRLVDALDEAQSELERFSSGRIMWIERPVFFPDRLAGEVIFKVPQSPNRTFVTDPFVRRIWERGLVGFDLQPYTPGSSSSAVAGTISGQAPSLGRHRLRAPSRGAIARLRNGDWRGRVGAWCAVKKTT
jgi:hypothetical protein